MRALGTAHLLLRPFFFSFFSFPSSTFFTKGAEDEGSAPIELLLLRIRDKTAERPANDLRRLLLEPEASSTLLRTEVAAITLASLTWTFLAAWFPIVCHRNLPRCKSNCNCTRHGICHRRPPSLLAIAHSVTRMCVHTYRFAPRYGFASPGKPATFALSAPLFSFSENHSLSLVSLQALQRLQQMHLALV